MCSSTPTVDQSAVNAQQKQPQYLRNPWLDNLSIAGNGATSGRNSLVIAPGSAPPSTTPSTSTARPPIWMPTANPGVAAGLGIRASSGGVGGVGGGSRSGAGTRIR